MNGKGGKHNPGKENSKGKKKQTKISKDTACSGTDKSTDCLGVNQKRHRGKTGLLTWITRAHTQAEKVVQLHTSKG